MSDYIFDVPEGLEGYLLKFLEKYIEEYLKDPTKPFVSIEDTHQGVFITVIYKNWAGFSDIVSIALHNENIDLSMYISFILKHKHDEYAVASAFISYDKLSKHDKSTMDRLKSESWRSLLKSSLEFLIKGNENRTIRELLSKSRFKINLLYELYRKFEEKFGHDSEEFKEITDPEGELPKFIYSRSEMYLSERSIDDLFDIIYESYKLQKEHLRKKEPVLNIRNYQTKKNEKLTSITVAGDPRMMNLKSVMDAVERIIGDYERKFDKEFTTSEGVTVVRLEISKNGDWLSEDEIRELEEKLIETLTSSDIDSMYPGHITMSARIEEYARVLIPRLIEEAKNTGMPQMYFENHRPTEDSYKYKFILTMPNKDRFKYITIGKITELLSNLGLVPNIERRIEENAKVICFNGIVDVPKEYRGTIQDDVKSKLEELLQASIREFNSTSRMHKKAKVEEILKLLDRDNLLEYENDVKKIFHNYDEITPLRLSTEQIYKEILALMEFMRSQERYRIDKGKDYYFCIIRDHNIPGLGKLIDKYSGKLIHNWVMVSKIKYLIARANDKKDILNFVSEVFKKEG